MVVAVVGIITLLSLWGTVRIYSRVDTDLTALLPDHYISVQTLRKIDQEGGKIYETVFVQGESRERMRAYAEAFKSDLEKRPFIARVEIHREDLLAKQHAFLALKNEQLQSILDRVKKKIGAYKIRKSGLFVSLTDDEPETAHASQHDLSLADIKESLPQAMVQKGTDDEYYFNRGKTALAMRIYADYPPSNFNYTGKVYQSIHQTVAALKPQCPGCKVSFLGPYRKRLDEFNLLKRDVNLIGSLTMAGVILSVLFYFKDLAAVGMISIPLTMGLLWTMGMADLAVGKLNTITAFLVGILSGMGIDFCIYLYSRYLEERQAGASTIEALVTTISQTGRAALTSGVNTSLVFFSLMLADFKGFSEFGFISGAGLLLCYLAIYGFLPFLIIWFERWGILNRKWHALKAIPWPKLPTLIAPQRKRFPMARSMIAFALTIAVIFVFVAPRLDFEYDFGKLRANLFSYQAEESLNETFNTGAIKGNSTLLIMNSRDDIPAVRKAINEKIRTDETPTLRGFLALDDVWPPPEVQNERMKIIAEIRSLLDEKTLHRLNARDRELADELRGYLDVQPYALEDVPKSTINYFSPRKAQGTQIGTYGYVLARPEIRTKDGRDAMKFAADARDLQTERGVFHSSSQELVFADVLGLMLHESRLTVIVALTLILVTVWIDFGSIWKTMVVLCPLVTGLMMTFVLLYSFGGKITFYNMITIPMIIGMGEDNAVHMYHRYLEMGKGSICKVLKTTGISTWMASITTILGFLGLVFSHHNGLKSIGYMAAAGLTGSLICSLLLLPAMVQFFEDRNIEIH